MPLVFQVQITPQDLRDHPDRLFLFGDNELRRGHGGQAAACRGHPNAVGIATKRSPRTTADAYWSDRHNNYQIAVVERDLARAFGHVRRGGTVVCPAAGLGTGLAELPTRAPRTYATLRQLIVDLKLLGEATWPTSGPHIFNKRSNDISPSAQYCGRPSPLGNPFAIGRDGTRGDVIRKYDAWIQTQPRLLDIARGLRSTDLACWCAPLPCHCDVLRRLANPDLYPRHRERPQTSPYPSATRQPRHAEAPHNPDPDSRQPGNPSQELSSVVQNQNPPEPNTPVRLAALLTRSPKQSPYFEKDLGKAARATQFIGEGSLASSTRAYATTLAAFANTGRYTREDLIFVSAEGTRTGRFNPIGASGPRGAYRFVDTAIDAGSSFVIDGPDDRHRSYNIGERQIAEYLTSRGYRETEPGVFVPADHPGKAPAARTTANPSRDAANQETATMSSRHEIPSKQPDHRVVVGWDNPMMTFFAQVERTKSPNNPQDPIVLWIGNTAHEHKRPETMASALAPYADLTRPILEALATDRHADLDRGPTPLQRAGLAFSQDRPESSSNLEQQETPMSGAQSGKPAQSQQQPAQPGADATKPAAEAKAPNPIKTLVEQMNEAAKGLGSQNMDLQVRIAGLADQAADPQRLQQPGFQTGIAYALQDLERVTGRPIPIDDALRDKMMRQATTMPGLTNNEMSWLLASTPNIADPVLVQRIRATAKTIAQHGSNQQTPEVEGWVRVLENAERLSREPRVPGNDVPRTPAAVADDSSTQNGPAATKPGTVEAAGAQRNDGNWLATARSTAQKGAVADIVKSMRAPVPNKVEKVWPLPATPVTDRISMFEQRLAAGKTDQLIRATETSGVKALEAAEQFINGPGRGVLGKMESAASTERGGMQTVLKEMQPGGRYANLRTEFDSAYQQDRIFAGAYDKMVQNAAQFGKDRNAVTTNYAHRNLDPNQLDARFQRAEEALGEAASKIPGRTPGKSALDEMAERLAEILRTAVERVKQWFGKEASAETRQEARLGPSMSM